MALLRDIVTLLKLLLTGLLIAVVGLVMAVAFAVVEGAKTGAGFACFIASVVAEDWRDRRR